MRIPDSVARAYDEELAIIEPLRDIAGTRLRVLAANNSWLFDDRVKLPESVLSKLESGQRSIRNMHDFYAAMIVVPTQKHVDSAVEKLLRAFNGSVKPTRTDLASSFVYDDVHIMAFLRGRISPRAVPHPAVLDREFEIQVHTGVQYAWWRATHDELYKGKESSDNAWSLQRASGQARASLELIDGVLGDFETASRLQRPGRRPADGFDIIREWVTSLPLKRRPTDEIRFISTVATMAASANITIDAIFQTLRSDGMRPFVADGRVTPVQLALIACHKLKGDELFENFVSARQSVLVTEELVDVYPEFRDIPPGIRVPI